MLESENKSNKKFISYITAKVTWIKLFLKPVKQERKQFSNKVNIIFRFLHALYHFTELAKKSNDLIR